MQEGVKLEDDKPNHHFGSLRGLLHNPPKGKLYESLKDANKMNEQVLHYQRYLREVHVIDGEDISFIDWLENNRIELNTILASAKPEPVWKWLKWKLGEVWPNRDYNRAIDVYDSMLSDTMDKFVEWCTDLSKPIIKDKVKELKETLSKSSGFFDDVVAKKEEIDNDIRDNFLMKHEEIQKVDLALKAIMENGHKK